MWNLQSVNPEISKISQADLNDILSLKREIFHSIYKTKEKCDKYTIENTDFKESIVMKVDGKIVWFYLLNPRNSDIVLKTKKSGTRKVIDPVLYKSLDWKKWIQWVTLGLAESRRWLWLGKILIEYPTKLGYDYIRWFQSKNLHNKDQRLKRRKILAESWKNYLTVEILSE